MEREKNESQSVRCGCMIEPNMIEPFGPKHVSEFFEKTVLDDGADAKGLGGTGVGLPTSSSSQNFDAHLRDTLIHNEVADAFHRRGEFASGEGYDPHKHAKALVLKIEEQRHAMRESAKQELVDTFAYFLLQANRRSEEFADIGSDAIKRTAHDMAVIAESALGKEKQDAKQDQGAHFCFPLDTKILMADLSGFPIEVVSNDARVRSYDTIRHTFCTGIVSATLETIADHYYSLNYCMLRVTGSHPLYVRDRNGQEGWAVCDPTLVDSPRHGVPTTALNFGHELFMKDDIWLPVKSVVRHDVEIRVKNLQFVNPARTFFADGVLVHNMSYKI
jgi:hypothetical protein